MPCVNCDAKRFYCKSRCKKCYDYLRRTGVERPVHLENHNNKIVHVKSIEERFENKTAIKDMGYITPCHVWLNCVSPKGYATFLAPKGKSNRVHKFLYEEINGKVPDGLELDHLCRIRHCVNPEHLEAVTHTENMKRKMK